MIQTITLMLLLVFACLAPAEAMQFAVARVATPVLNSSDFKGVFGGSSGRELMTDRCGQVRNLEYIAPPGTVFRILKKHPSGMAAIYQVETEEYAAPTTVSLYVDGRFLKFEAVTPAPRRRTLPPRNEIIAALKRSVGNSYVWGGNVPGGVPELAEWFYTGIKDGDRGRLTLAGLDCSGLLYQATNGWTPRNTSQLINFGSSVAIAGKQPAEIAAMLQPLDLIVWSGHVIIVIDQQSVIESRLECGKPSNGGVVITPLSQRIAEIMRSRRPANLVPPGNKRNDTFVVRRWNTDI